MYQKKLHNQTQSVKHFIFSPSRLLVLFLSVTAAVLPASGAPSWNDCWIEEAATERPEEKIPLKKKPTNYFVLPFVLRYPGARRHSYILL